MPLNLTGSAWHDCISGLRYPSWAMRGDRALPRQEALPAGAVGVQGPRGFDQGGQDRGFSRSQLRGGFAEIDPSPGLHPQEVIAHGYPVEVAPQNFLLAENQFHPQAAADLHQFAIITAGSGVGETGQLLA